MAGKILHWFWKMTRFETECDYFCGDCPHYESCRALAESEIPPDFYVMPEVYSHREAV